MTAAGAAPIRRRPFLDWKGVLGVLLSLVLLWYTFRDVDLAEVWHEIRAANVPLLILTSIALTLPFPLRAFRWRPLLRPAFPGTRFRPRYAATCIGFMANNLLPARVGEFARAYAITRFEPVRASAAFGSLVVERLFDALMVVALLFIALGWPGFPEMPGQDFGSIAAGAAAVLAGGFVVLLLMATWPATSVRVFERTVARILPRRLRRLVIDALAAFLDGTAALRDWRLLLQVLAWSIVLWLNVAVATWIGFHAFGIHAPFIAAVFLQSIIALAVSLPSAPGFFGVFEAAARVGLVQVWGVDSSRAVAFALGLHLAGFIPVTALGLYYLWRAGLSWSDMGRSEIAVEEAVEARSEETTSPEAGLSKP